MIVHEDSAFGSGLAKLLNTQLPERGFQVIETIPHPTPTRDFNNVVLENQRAESRPRDPGELLQRIRPARAHHAAAEGAAEGDLLGARRRGLVLQVRQGIPRGRAIHHGLQSLVRPEEPEGARAEEEGRGEGRVLHLRGLHELFGVLLLADALERAASADRAKIIAALESSTFSGHVMPYGPTKFVNGQNQGAAPVNTQVIGNDIQVIFPAAFASAKPVFPMPPA